MSLDAGGTEEADNMRKLAILYRILAGEDRIERRSKHVALVSVS